MVSLYFDEEHHPEMLSVTLKGKYLKEFVALCNQEVIARQADDASELEKININVLADTGKALSPESAAQFGINMYELRSLVDGIAKVDTKNISSMDTYLQASKAHDEEFGETQFQEGMKKYNAEIGAETLMNYFSACLAAQENKEKYYVDMMTDYYKERLIPSFKYQIKDINKFSSPENKEYASTFMSSLMVNPLAFHQRNNERGSLITPMGQEIIFGKNPTLNKIGGIRGEIRKILAEINGLDVNKLADAEKLRDLEKLSLGLATLSMGVILYSPPEIG